MNAVILVIYSIFLIARVRATRGTSFQGRGPSSQESQQAPLCDYYYEKPESHQEFYKPKSQGFPGGGIDQPKFTSSGVRPNPYLHQSEEGESPSGGPQQISSSFPGSKQEPLQTRPSNPHIPQFFHEMYPNYELTKAEVYMSTTPTRFKPERRTRSQASSQTSNEDERPINLFSNIPKVDSDERPLDLGKKIRSFKHKIHRNAPKVPKKNALYEKLDDLGNDKNKKRMTFKETEKVYLHPPKRSNFSNYVMLFLAILVGGFLIWYFIKNRQPK